MAGDVEPEGRAARGRTPITGLIPLQEGAGVAIEAGLLVRLALQNRNANPVESLRRPAGERHLHMTAERELLSREAGMMPLQAFGKEKGWV